MELPLVVAIEEPRKSNLKLIHLQTVLCLCVAFEVTHWKVVYGWERRHKCFGCLCIQHMSKCVNKRLTSQICSQNLLHSNQKEKTDLKQIKEASVRQALFLTNVFIQM